eukprot:m.11990 g.11990  ORF g.11990 m.11990 type:complete len:478 (-) comp5796_c0_seq1:1307-2740(-)
MRDQNKANVCLDRFSNKAKEQLLVMTTSFTGDLFGQRFVSNFWIQCLDLSHVSLRTGGYDAHESLIISTKTLTSLVNACCKVTCWVASTLHDGHHTLCKVRGKALLESFSNVASSQLLIFIASGTDLRSTTQGKHPVQGRLAGRPALGAVMQHACLSLCQLHVNFIVSIATTLQHGNKEPLVVATCFAHDSLFQIITVEQTLVRITDSKNLLIGAGAQDLNHHAIGGPHASHCIVQRDCIEIGSRLHDSLHKGASLAGHLRFQPNEQIGSVHCLVLESQTLTLLVVDAAKASYNSILVATHTFKGLVKRRSHGCWVKVGVLCNSSRRNWQFNHMLDSSSAGSNCLSCKLISIKFHSILGISITIGFVVIRFRFRHDKLLLFFFFLLLLGLFFRLSWRVCSQFSKTFALSLKLSLPLLTETLTLSTHGFLFGLQTLTHLLHLLLNTLSLSTRCFGCLLFQASSLFSSSNSVLVHAIIG